MGDNNNIWNVPTSNCGPIGQPVPNRTIVNTVNVSYYSLRNLTVPTNEARTQSYFARIDLGN